MTNDTDPATLLTIRIKPQSRSYNSSAWQGLWDWCLKASLNRWGTRSWWATPTLNMNSTSGYTPSCFFVWKWSTEKGVFQNASLRNCNSTFSMGETLVWAEARLLNVCLSYLCNPLWSAGEAPPEVFLKGAWNTPQNVIPEDVIFIQIFRFINGFITAHYDSCTE